MLLPVVEVLEAGQSPANLKVWHGKGQSALHALGVEHLLMLDWAKVSSSVPVQSKVALLLAKKRRQAAAALEAGEDVPKLESKYVGTYVERHTVGEGDASSNVVHFQDPLEEGDVPESAGDRSKRMIAWTWYCDSLKHHPEVVAVVTCGDIANLVMMVMSKCVGEESVKIITNIFDMTSLKKKPGEPWSVMCAELVRLHSEMSQVEDPRYMIGPGVLPAFALRGLDFDDAYKVNVELLRRDKEVTVERIVQDISVKAVAVEAANTVTSSVAIKGLTASAHVGKDKGDGRGAGKGGGGRGVCFLWRDKGTCRFGEDCRYSHAPSTRDACHECGSKDHGVHRCPRKKAREEAASIKAMSGKAGEASATMEEQIAQLQAQVSAMKAAATGSGLAGRAAALSGTDPLAVHDCGDSELASIWAGRADP